MLKTIIMLLSILFATSLYAKNIDKYYFDYIQNHIDIKVEDVNLTTNTNTVDITTNITWSLKNSTIFLDKLKKYIEITPESKKDIYGLIHYPKNPKYYTIDSSKNKKLFKELISKQILIRIRYGKYTNYIPISTGMTYDNNKYGKDKLLLITKKEKLKVKFHKVPKQPKIEDLKIQADIIKDKPFYNLLPKYKDARNYDFSLFKPNNIKYELEEFEWRISKIEVNAGKLQERLKQRKKLVTTFIKKIKLHKENWVNLKLQELNLNYNNTKKTRDNIFLRANNIENNYTNRLYSIINKVLQRTNQQNKLYVENNYIVHYGMAYR